MLVCWDRIGPGRKDEGWAWGMSRSGGLVVLEEVSGRCRGERDSCGALLVATGEKKEKFGLSSGYEGGVEGRRVSRRWESISICGSRRMAKAAKGTGRWEKDGGYSGRPCGGEG